MKYLEQGYEEEFNTLMENLKEKYGQKMFDLDGIGKQLNMSKFSKEFFTTRVTADASVDSNSNVYDNSVISYDVEFAKPFLRYNSYYMLWREMKRLYGQEVSNTIIEHQLSGDIYINDFHGIGSAKPYCNNYSTYDIMMNGLPMIEKPKSLPPKSLYAFKSQVEQFSIIAANSTLGATGLSDFFIVMSYYVDQIFKTGKDAHTYFDGWFSDQEKKMLSEGTYQDIYHDAPTYLHEVDWFEEYTTCHIKRTEPHDKEWFTMNVWRYVRESIASFLYTINQPLRAHQAVFSNVSIYDDAFLDAMLLDYIFPDGNTPNKETVKEIQRIFLSTMNSEMSRTVYTFPVVTACFAKDKETGELIKGDLFDELPKYAMKYSFVNIYTGDTATLSSCCFGANQSVLTKSDNGVALTPIKDICQEHGWKKYRKNLTVFHNGSWQKAKRVEIPYNNELYKITTSNNKELFVTDDHLHLTMNGDKKTTALTTDDYLAFNVRPLDTFAERDEKLTYAQGFLLGVYLGDGSKYKRKDSESYEVTFSLNANKLAHVGLLEEALYDWGIDKELHIYDGKNNVKFVKFYSKELFDIVNKYIRGSYSHEKEIDMCVLLQSQKFRKGIVDGWYMTDGGNSNRIYTTSKRLIDTGEALFTSLGMNTIITVSDKTGKATIRNEEFTRNYPLYCIRWYDTLNKLTMKDVYIVKNNTEYFKIKSIEKYEHADTVYCFEMNNSDIPYFTLPNGIMTHNCRLRSDTTNEYFNSFGAGSAKIGSVGVVTINLPRLAEKCKSDKDKFIDDIKYFTNVCAKVNNAKRHIVRKKIENGNHPLYTLGFADLSRQYSTVGMNGIYEAIEYLGMDITTNAGAEYLLKVLDTVNKTNDMNSKRYTSPHNCEQVPKMCGDVKSYLIDLECHENMVDKGQARQFINVCAA